MLCNSCEWYEYGDVGSGQCGNKDSKYYEQDVKDTTTCIYGPEE